MYAIANVCYGIPLNKATTAIVDKYFNIESTSEDESDEEEECYGVDDYFTTFYSGSAHYSPGVCGIELSSFDECSNISVPEMIELLKPPTQEQINEAMKKIAEIPEGLRKLLPEPSHFIIWSTS